MEREDGRGRGDVIAMLEGTLLRRQRDDQIVLGVGGVGFRVHVPASTASVLPGIGETVTLHVYTHVREDVLALYGFATEDEMSLFEDIISVSGMGPRLALTSLSTLQPAQFRRAVLHEDVATLTRISGVGKKTAQRLILELRGKLSPVAELEGAAAPPGLTEPSPAAEEALAALVALGYSEAEARPALSKATEDAAGPPEQDVTALLRRALKHLAG